MAVTHQQLGVICPYSSNMTPLGYMLIKDKRYEKYPILDIRAHICYSDTK
jgi:hypothetical protein